MHALKESLMGVGSLMGVFSAQFCDMFGKVDLLVQRLSQTEEQYALWLTNNEPYGPYCLSRIPNSSSPPPNQPQPRPRGIQNGGHSYMTTHTWLPIHTFGAAFWPVRYAGYQRYAGMQYSSLLGSLRMKAMYRIGDCRHVTSIHGLRYLFATRDCRLQIHRFPYATMSTVTLRMRIVMPTIDA